MNSKAKQTVKSHLPEYLEQKGYSLTKPFRCINPEHEDRHPSMSYNKHKNNIHCFSCGVTYDIFDCIRILEGFVDNKDVFAFAEKEFLNRRQSFSEPAKKKSPSKFSFSSLTMTAEGYEYLSRRGISKRTADKFGVVYSGKIKIGLGEEDEPWKAIIIPTGDGCYTIRNTKEADSHYRIRKVGGFPVFNASVMYEDKDSPVFVTEGELDALSFYEADADALSLGSVTNNHRFIDIVKNRKPLRKLILCLDNDEKGKAAQRSLAKSLAELDIPYEEINVAGECKDANEALQTHREDFLDLVSCISHEKEYADKLKKQDYINSSAICFLSSLKSETFIRTGFKKFDELLGGGLYNEFYILGGGSSVGKTSFVLQLADQIAAAGRSVLFFTLEMSGKTMVSKSLSRMCFTADRDNAMTARQITSLDYKPSPEQQMAYDKAIERYRKFGKNIFLCEAASTNIKDLFKTAEEHIRITGNKPVVFIDYLQLLDSSERKNTDKQNIDACVRDLKRFCRNFNLPVVAISSFSRSGYKEEAAFESFKESGNIEYSSDVLLALQFEGVSKRDFSLNEEKRKAVRSLELVILKNRSGAAGEKIKFKYFPQYNIFKETN